MECVPRMYCGEPGTWNLTDAWCHGGYYCNSTISRYTCPPTYACPPNSTQPTACHKGEYCPQGSSERRDCEGGHYCPDPDVQKPCPATTYCEPGSTASTPCSDKPGNPDGHYCPEKSVTPYCPAGSYCPEYVICYPAFIYPYCDWLLLSSSLFPLPSSLSLLVSPTIVYVLLQLS